MTFPWQRRKPRHIWAQIRERIWERDGGKCVRCGCETKLKKQKADPPGTIYAHIDHIVEKSRDGKDSDENLRTLCATCHVLRRDRSHRGMTASALRKGWIDPNWREKVW